MIEFGGPRSFSCGSFKVARVSLKGSVLSACTLFGLVGTGLSSAQTLVTGDIAGHLTDPSGAAIPNATLALKNQGTGASQQVKSDGSGSFRFSLLQPGLYAIHEEGSGLSADVKNVAVNVGQATPLTVIASPNGGSTVVEVNTNQPLIQSEDANISSTFSTAQIETLPIPGGDISNLPFTTPGVSLSTGDGYGNFSAFGLPGTSNIFTVNGADLMDAYLNLPNSGASNNVLGANELTEAAVVVNGYTGQYGRLAGAQVNYTTKSGANAFHGNGLFYYNSSGFNANDWFLKQSQIAAGVQNAQPHAVSRQWAGSVGGPIVKNKLFFFFDDEGLRYALPGGGVQTYLPSTAFQNATLANISATQPGEVNLYQTAFKLYSGANGFATAQPSSSSDGGCGDFAGTTVRGTTFGAASAGLTPCSVVFVPNNNNLNTEQLFTIRIDSNLTKNDQVNARVRHDWGVQATGTDPVNTAFSANSTQPEWDGQLNETHIFSSSVVNSGTVSALYYSALFGPPNFANSIATFPTTFIFSDGDGFANLGGDDNTYPSGRNVAQYQFIDDLSITHGKHSMKFGFNFRRFNMTVFSPLAGHTGSTTFGSNTDFYNGVVSNIGTHASGSSTTQAFSAISAGHWALYDLGVYLQDQIAVTRKFKLTASLRFDRTGNPACRANCFVRLNGPFDQISHGSSIPYNQSILSSQSNALQDIESVIPQPRLGFAYSPFGSRTVIRGGAGLFADILVPSVFSRFITNAPDYLSLTLSPSASATPVGAQTFLVQPGAAGSSYNSLQTSYTAFQNGFNGGATLAQLQTGTGGLFNTPNYTASVANKLRNAKFTEFNLEVQQALSRYDVLDINYVGNFGTDILLLNPTANAYASCLTNGRCPNGFAGLPTTQPDSRFLAVTTLTNNGHSNYSGITGSIRHQGGHGLTAALNYTYGHSLDNVSNGGANPFAFNGSTGASEQLSQVDPRSPDTLIYGNSDYDFRHNVNMNYAYSPVFNVTGHLLRSALTGFTLSGTLFMKSGAPYTPIRGSLSSYFTSSTNGGSTLGAFLGGPLGPCGDPSNTCLSPSQFATRNQQPIYGFGNIARNSFRGPGYFDTDLQFAKVTPISERVKVKFGANIFNVINHPNFALPNNNLASSTFGQIQADTPPVSSPYGNFQGAGVSGRIIQVVGGISF